MKKAIFIFIAILAFTACNKEQYSDIENSKEISFDFGFPGQTKATASSFESGDAVSLFAVEYDGSTQMPLQISGNYINNEKLTFNGSSWSGNRPLFWGDNACDFYAIYPYSQSITSIEAYPFSVDTDQNGTGYNNSDLLYAKRENVSPGADAVQLQFYHILSKLIVNIEVGPNFEGEITDDIVTHVYNTNVDCDVNLSTGAIEARAFGSKSTITMRKLSNTQFEAVIIPQSIESKTSLIEITMGGIAYLLDYKISFRSGYVHTVNVTLNSSPEQEKYEISIDPDINGWN